MIKKAHKAMIDLMGLRKNAEKEIFKKLFQHHETGMV